jgi:outer membrane protein OmpA-like peptidoglycan-associated protein
MHIFTRLLPAILSAFLFLGCAPQKPAQTPAEKKDIFVLLPDQDGKVGEITISNGVGSTTLSKANQSAEVSSTHVSTQTTILSQKEIQKEFHDTLQAIPGTADQYILYFTPGTTDLTKESWSKLPLILKRVKERLPCEISIIGHADTQASSEYNLSLALQRAVHVKNKLLAIGVPRELLEVSSHGENDPMIPTADNVAEPKNRRVELFIR